MSAEQESLQPPTKKPVVIIDGWVEVDSSDYRTRIEKLVEARKTSDLETNIRLLDAIPRELLKDALTPFNRGEKDNPAINYAMNEYPAKMSSIIEGGYGVCRHYVTISAIVAKVAGISLFVIQGNFEYGHTFARVKIGDE